MVTAVGNRPRAAEHAVAWVTIAVFVGAIAADFFGARVAALGAAIITVGVIRHEAWQARTGRRGDRSGAKAITVSVHEPRTCIDRLALTDGRVAVVVDAVASTRTPPDGRQDPSRRSPHLR
jgi:hypothetical protein